MAGDIGFPIPISSLVCPEKGVAGSSGFNVAAKDKGEKQKKIAATQMK